MATACSHVKRYGVWGSEEFLPRELCLNVRSSFLGGTAPGGAGGGIMANAVGEIVNRNLGGRTRKLTLFTMPAKTIPLR